MPADKPAYFDILVFYIRNNIFYKFPLDPNGTS